MLQKKRLVQFVSLLPILFMSATAQAADLAILSADKAKSKIEFTAVQNDAPTKGEFKDYSAEIKFHPDKLAESSVQAQIEIASVWAAYEEIASTLKGSEWLEAEKFPTAKFESTSFKKISDKNYTCEGNLTIRDVTKPASITFVLDSFSETSASITGELNIKRNDFGIGQGEWKDTSSIKDEVKLELKITAVAKH